MANPDQATFKIVIDDPAAQREAGRPASERAQQPGAPPPAPAGWSQVPLPPPGTPRPAAPPTPSPMSAGYGQDLVGGIGRLLERRDAERRRVQAPQTPAQAVTP